MNILHISDLHAGVSNSDWMWPNVKESFKNDLLELVDSEGNVDLILFSGDLSQKGTQEEFQQVGNIIEWIRDFLLNGGVKPHLICIPGNHDLARPKANSQITYALNGFISNASPINNILDPSGDLKPAISNLFSEYDNFTKIAIDSLGHLEPETYGLLPGDASYSLDIDGFSLGIVALNSTWLQVQAGNYENKIFIDPKQLLTVTENDPDSWIRQHDVAIIVTHHPTSWLSSAGREVWLDDISPPGRFYAHLFGHMHDHNTLRTQFGGSAQRLEIQAASLLGLEFISGDIERKHGYSLIKIDGHNQDLLPRTVIKLDGGGRIFGPDLKQNLSHGKYLRLPEIAAAPSTPMGTERFDPVRNSFERLDISNFYHESSGSSAHSHIRRQERETLSDALSRDGIAWVVNDWGKGSEGFIKSFVNSDQGKARRIIRINLENFVNLEDFLSTFRIEKRMEFEAVCELISRESEHLLLFDNIHLPDADKRTIADIEFLSEIVREFSPKSQILMHGRIATAAAQFDIIELDALDEADTGDYLVHHELGKSHYSSPAILNKIWLATGGLPDKIDTFLAELEVTSLSDLLKQEQYHARPGDEKDSDDVTLTNALGNLRASKKPVSRRAAQLLDALSVLPQGEQLERIKRFYGPDPIYSNHALELSNRRLLGVESLTSGKVGKLDEEKKTLVVPKVVREKVRSSFSRTRLRNLDNKALELYFGTKWKTGNISGSLAARQCKKPVCEPYEIINSSTLITRSLSQAVASSNRPRISQLLILASAFIAVLETGSHFRAAAELAEEVHSIIPDDEFPDRVDVIRFQLGKNLRMLGRRSEAQTLFDQIDVAHLSSDQKRSITMNRALIAEMDGDDVNATKFAREVLKGGRTDGYGFQAQQILTEQLADTEEKLAKLRDLEKRARNKKRIISANNIALAIASETDNKQERATSLQAVLTSNTAHGDFYNATRATLRIFRDASLQADINPDLVQFLIKVYEHLYNERSEVLFDECHDALWKIFGQARDTENLIRLFRYSSFTWRIRGADQNEARSLADLLELSKKIDFFTLKDVEKEVRYFKNRLATSDNMKKAAIASSRAT